MREIPDCLNRRYEALDELINELSAAASNGASDDDYQAEPTNDPGVRLMCDFWNILKEDPDCNLTQAVRQRMGVNPKASMSFRPQRVTCYMACSHDDPNANSPCKKDSKTGSPRTTPEKTGNSPRSPDRTCCSSKVASPKGSIKSENLPLSKVLCNLKEAVSFDKKCNIRIGELLLAEKQLQDQIQHLEHNEKEGMKLLKQADCMWSCMEEAYKKKVAESQERQNLLLKQMKEVESSNTKWRKNKKDLEFQCDNINKCYFEIIEKMHEKKNDVKCIKMEIENMKKRIEANKKDTEAVKKSFGNKKTVSDGKIAGISAQMTKIRSLIEEEQQLKNEKEEEGSRYVREARSDLQKICRVLLQKRLENEDLRAEKEALLEEIEILKQTCEQCKEKCKKKQQDVIDEIAKVDADINGFTVRCIRCHECTDTLDARKFCTDCPRCAAERDCILENDHCLLDSTQDCVCMSTKQKFLDNVFDNMYTVLERQSKTCPGKAVAQAVLDCLKRSRNGKLNEETRRILQDFVLTTVKKNLNLTIIGGAVKTRCEMDPETYKQLMLCLKQVKTVKAPKVDHGTDAKKDACRRWGGTNECNCPKGPKSCICTKKAPPPPNDPEPCPQEVDKEDAGEVTVCPHKGSIACGADCAMHAVPSAGAVGTEVASWRPAPCDEKHCQFSKNMRAAQCVLGPDSLSSVSKSKAQLSATPLLPDVTKLEDQISCKCGPSVTKPCICRKDKKHLKINVTHCDHGTRSFLYDQVKGIPSTQIGTCNKEYNKDTKEVINTENLAKNSKLSFTSPKKDSIEKIEELQKELSKKESRHRKTSPKLCRKSHKQTESKKSYSENKNVKFGEHSESQTDQQKYSCEEHFKISLENDSSQFTKLTNTPSGSLAMELDVKLIEQIEQKMQGSTSLSVSLQRTQSGHLEIDFSPDSSSKNMRKINVKKSTSGNLIFEVDKKTIDILKPDIDIGKNNLELDNKPSISVSITPKKCEKKGTIESTFEKENTVIQENNFLAKIIKDKEVLANREKSAENVLKLKEISGTFTQVEANITKTKSGDIVYTITNISSLGLMGEMINKGIDQPAEIFKSSSGSHLLDLKSNTPNATVRKTSSGKKIIVKLNSVLQTLETTKNCCIRPNRNIFKVSIQDGKSKIENLPIVLESTASNNYIAIVDKEYETYYKQTIKNSLSHDYQCPVELVSTPSGNRLLNLDHDNQNHVNALIVRSQSGNIQVKSNVSDKIKGSIDSKAMSKASSKLFESMLHSIPQSFTEEKSAVNKPRLLETKSSSDSNLYEKVRLRLHNQHNLLSEPSALLKKTSSGQYAVVLNKESKKTFINNLKSYLANNTKGLIPIRRTESGEITIVLNNDNESKGKYGSLKITPSGNIFILVDEKVINSMVKTATVVNTPVDTDSHPLNDTETDQNTENKVVTTTCNAFPETCSCDPSKCVCAELMKHGVNDAYYNNQSPTCSIRYCQPKDKNVNQCNHKCCECGQCQDTCDTRYDEKSPHIVIKPCNCQSEPHKNLKNNNSKPLYYVTEAVCPFHKNRYDTVSNELLEISGLCNKADKIISDETRDFNPDFQQETKFPPSSSDYFDHLPLQLPVFLKDFKCA